MSATARLGLAGAAMIAVTYGFGRYGYGLFAPRIVDEFGLSVTAVGVIAGATYVSYLVALTLVGALTARLGPRPLVLAAGVAASAGTAMVAFAPNTGWLVAGLVIAGSSPGWAWAPFSDAADRMAEPARRDTVLGLVASGTAFGVAFAGPVALLLGLHWRAAWLTFAVVGTVVTVVNAWVLPAGPNPVPRTPTGRSFLQRAGVRLYLTAASYGFVGAVYWTFAVTVVERSTPYGAAAPLVAWSVLGIAGTAAAFTGTLVGRIGLRATHTVLFASLAAAIALLGLAPGNLLSVGVSVMVFGATYMAGSGLLAMWSYRLVPSAPSTALSVTVFFLGLGSITGPVALGAVADGYGLRSAFLLAATLTAVTTVARPAQIRELSTACEHAGTR